MNTTLSLGVVARLTGVNCAPSQLASGATATCTLGLDQPASNPLLIAINSSGTAVTVPPSVLVRTGFTATSFQINAGIAASPQSVGIMATTENSVQASVSVMPGNPPVLNAPAQLAATPSSPVLFTISASDPYNLPLVLSASGLPAGAAFDPGTGKFTWTPDPSQTGTFPIVLTASDAAGLSTSQNLVITVAPAKAVVLGLYNAATYALDKTCSTGSLGSLVGANFASQGLQVAGPLPWPTQLAGVRVTLNNTDAPILSISDTLIQFQCPILSAGAQVTLTVEPASGGPSDPLQFVMAEATPGVFIMNATNQGAVLIAGTADLAMPTTDAMPSRPANPGEYLSIYANGLGPVQEVVPAGSAAPTDHTIQATDQIVVGIGGVELQPSFAGLAPGLAGLYQVNVQLPPDAVTGDAVPLYVRVILADGTSVQSNTVTVSIQAASQQ